MKVMAATAFCFFLLLVARVVMADPLYPLDGQVRMLDFPKTLRWLQKKEPMNDWKTACPTSKPYAYILFNYSHPDPVEFLSLHLGSLKPAETSDWRIVIRNQTKDCIGSISSDEIFPTGFNENAGYWTVDLPGRVFRLEIYGAQYPEGLSFKIDKFLVSSIEESNKVYMDDANPTIVPVEVFREDETIWVLGRAVGRLQITVNGKRRPCTGFLISEKTLLTNRHCFCTYAECSTQELTKENVGKLCEQTDVVFGYTREPVEQQIKYSCRRVLHTSYPLDYAILELWGSPGKVWGTLPLQKEGELLADDNKSFMVIQHSNDKNGMKGYKGIALANCKIIDIKQNGRRSTIDSKLDYRVPQDFHHSCDTSGGSSGSPVMTKEGEVVGLHRGGRRGSASEGNRFNRAVYISLIMDDIGFRRTSTE